MSVKSQNQNTAKGQKKLSLTWLLDNQTTKENTDSNPTDHGKLAVTRVAV
jgi:hypothetical protein